VRFAWLDVGHVIAAPAKSAHGPNLTLTAATETLFPAVTAAQQVLIEDGANDGAAAKVVTSAPPSASLALTDIPSLSTELQAPLRVLLNLLHVSRGKTVPSEILGSGDAAAQGQEFVLQKSPLTYVAGTDLSSPEAYRSTLRAWVDGVEWKEVPSFYGQAPDAAVFVTKEDEEQKTYAQFGDGVHGARLPSGVNNVVASYRYESGAVVPEAGKLTVLLKSLPGLKAIVNPIPPAGGADPDPPDRLRALAPRSVLTFNRAVSANDYEVIAAQTPGVARARAYWSFDAARQQTLVTVYVGDTAGAVAVAQQALMRVMDPNRSLSLKQAQPISLRLHFAVKLAKGHLADPVVAAVKSALTDADRGLLGLNVTRIGQTLFRSQIYEACLGVAGVEAVHNLMVFVKLGETSFLLSGYRFFSGEGVFFQLAPDDLVITVEAASNA
jgi:predicted phage baseplate assembly protein